MKWKFRQISALGKSIPRMETGGKSALLMKTSKDFFCSTVNYDRRREQNGWVCLSVQIRLFGKREKDQKKNSDVCPFPRWAYVQ